MLQQLVTMQLFNLKKLPAARLCRVSLCPPALQPFQHVTLKERRQVIKINTLNNHR